MRTPLSPLDLPELTDYCVEFLRDSVSDLKRCALVSRLWVNSAQARIFHNIRITSRERSGNERAWSRLEGTLRTSPHLVRHIHRLEVDSDAYSNKEEVLSAICCFPFTHLEDACIIHISLLSLPLALAIQQLLSLCTLRRLKISLHFDQRSLFLQMWDHCSPSLGHLELYFCERPKWHTSHRVNLLPDLLSGLPNHRATPIALESLRITYMSISRADWLKEHYLGRLNFSRLKVLSIGKHAELASQEYWAPAMGKIEALDFTAKGDTQIDLSSFPNLALLRVSIPGPTGRNIALGTLSTLTPSNLVCKIIIHSSNLDAVACDELDSRICDLRMSHLTAIEIEMDTISGGLTMVNLEESFKRLSSRTTVSPIERNDFWFETFSRV